MGVNERHWRKRSGKAYATEMDFKSVFGLLDARRRPQWMSVVERANRSIIQSHMNPNEGANEEDFGSKVILISRGTS